MSKLRQEKLQRKLQSPGLDGSLQLKFEVFKRVFGDNERRFASHVKEKLFVQSQESRRSITELRCHVTYLK